MIGITNKRLKHFRLIPISVAALIIPSFLLASCSNSSEEPPVISETDIQNVKEACFEAVREEMKTNTQNASGTWDHFDTWNVSERESENELKVYAIDAAFTPDSSNPVTFSCLVNLDPVNDTASVKNSVVARMITAPTTSPASESTGPSNEPIDIIVDGTFLVGTDILPGTYRFDGSQDRCYWERLSGFSGTSEDIIANDNPRGQAFVTIEETDKAFRSNRCGVWIMVDENKPQTDAVNEPEAAAFDPEPTPAAQDTYVAPAPAPVTSAPVMGFTGAPGVDPIKPLDKTISHCGDPMMYQTGTTFFTDGTTGWTETCSQQMLQ